MINGFIIDIKEIKEIKCNEIFEKSNVDFTLDLEKYLTSNGSLNGDLISDDIFPCTEDYNLFISHSHSDAEEIKPFISYMESCGFKVFLDSYIWGSAQELLKKIDKKYCYKPESKTYNYSKRNFSTSHVHLMLSVALGKVINNSKNFLFIKSNDSLTVENIIKNKTYSPWIFQELFYFELLKTKMISGSESIYSENLQIERDIDKYLCNLKKIKKEDIIQWCNQKKII